MLEYFLKTQFLFHRIKLPILSRITKLSIRLLFCCVVPPECKIGINTKFWHNGLGVIIHPNVIIGNECNIYNHVVMGGGHDGPDGPPIKIIIGDSVNIGTGAKILCKKDTLYIGSHSTIGANAVVIDDVPPYSVVGGIPARVLKFKT